LGDGLVQECQLTGIPNRGLQQAGMTAYPLVLCDKSGHIIRSVGQTQLFEQIAHAVVAGFHGVVLGKIE
jgi:hypothetical protein